MKHVARFKFIEAMIMLNGQVKRAHLQRAFALKEASVSRVFKHYKQASNGAIGYDVGKKATIALGEFKPMFLDTDPLEFFDAAQLLADEPILEGDRRFCGCGTGCDWCGGTRLLTPTVRAAKTELESKIG